MVKTPNHPKFRTLGGALLALSLATSLAAVGCDDDASVDQPMRSMQDAPLPRVTEKALSTAPRAGATAGEADGAARAPVAQAEPVVEHAKAERAKAESRNDAASSAAEAAEEFSVKRLVLTTGIKDKEPVPTEDFVPDGTPVIAFVELSNPAASNTEIEIVFEHESGRQVGFVKLDVPGQHERWRTWGQTRQIRQSGRWVAVVRNGEGQELMRKAFAVGAG